MPNVFTGSPNPSGVNTPVPSVGATPTPAIGGNVNPLIQSYPAGTAAPGPTSTFPAYTTAGTDTNAITNALSQLNPGAALGGPGSDWTHTLIGAFHKAGFSSPIAAALANFLSTGAGFNPQVVQSLLAALGPGIASGRANIMESFGAEGLGSSSPAALGLAGFDAQVTLDEGQIISQMYEQSVQNYMDVLLSGREPQSKQGGMGSLFGGIGNLASGASSLASLIPTGGAAAAGAATTAAPEIAAVAGML
jgi:hypothetical protein